MSDTRRSARRCLCGVLLARDNPDNRCASCAVKSRREPLSAPEVSPTFWDHDTVRDALASRHMGRVIRAFRLHPDHRLGPISQETAAAWAGVTQAQLSRIENGPPMLHLDRLMQWARTLRIPAEYLWFSLPDDAGTRGESDHVNRSQFLRVTGAAVAGTVSARLFAGLPVASVSEQDCAQWLAWEMWKRRVDAVHGTELPPAVARFLATHTAGRPTGRVILGNPDGSYTFAHPSFINFYVAQRMFDNIAAGDNKLFATAQTTHETDLIIREFVLRNQSSAKTLTQWMRRAKSPVLRVNSAGVLAKLSSHRLDDEVIRALKSDVDTRQLYITAVASRVLELPWGHALRLASSIERGPGQLASQSSADQATNMANRLAGELSNPRDGAARWCGVVLIDQLQHAAPSVTSAALHAALRQEKGSENLRSIGAALAGDSPISY